PPAMPPGPETPVAPIPPLPPSSCAALIVPQPTVKTTRALKYFTHDALPPKPTSHLAVLTEQRIARVVPYSLVASLYVRASDEPTRLAHGPTVTYRTEAG